MTIILTHFTQADHMITYDITKRMKVSITLTKKESDKILKAFPFVAGYGKRTVGATSPKTLAPVHRQVDYHVYNIDNGNVKLILNFEKYLSCL